MLSPSAIKRASIIGGTTPPLLPEFTFARTGNASYFDNQGVMQFAGTDEERTDHDPADQDLLGLRIEGARTNLCLQSEDFDTTWTKEDTATITTNTDVAPDGSTTADTLTDNETTVAGRFRQNFTVANDGESHIFSVFIKKDSDTSRFPVIQAFYSGGSFTQRAQSLNTQTGVRGTAFGLTAPESSGSEDYGDYWRWWVRIPNNSSGNTNFSVRLYPAAVNALGGVQDNNVTGSIVAWGAQVEKAGHPSAYIPTTTVAVARNAETATYGFSKSLFSIVVSGRPPHDVQSEQVLWCADDGTTNEEYRLFRNASNEVRFTVTDGGVEVVNLNLGSVADNADFKVALSVDVDDVRGSLNGAAVVSDVDTSGALPTVTTGQLGHDSAGNHWYGTILSVQTFDDVVPDTTLRSLST